MGFKTVWKLILLDLLAGFAALGLTIAGTLLAHYDNDSRVFVAVTALFFLLAGAARAGTGSGNQLSNISLSVFSIPKLIILDQTGRIRLIHEGFDGAEPFVGSLSRDIDRLLGVDR